MSGDTSAAWGLRPTLTRRPVRRPYTNPINPWVSRYPIRVFAPNPLPDLGEGGPATPDRVRALSTHHPRSTTHFSRIPPPGAYLWT